MSAKKPLPCPFCVDTKLKPLPCPFCGVKWTHNSEIENHRITFYFPHLDSCFLASGSFLVPEYQLSAWNRRAARRENTTSSAARRGRKG